MVRAAIASVPLTLGDVADPRCVGGRDLALMLGTDG